MTRVSDIGEFGLIERIRSRKSYQDEDLVVGIGDDCAVVRRGPVLEVLTTDCLVGGTHFEDDWLTMKDIGWKALSRKPHRPLSQPPHLGAGMVLANLLQ